MILIDGWIVVLLLYHGFPEYGDYSVTATYENQPGFFHLYCV